eukprot:TRINITY_DN2989_c0_g1_i1.p1 TRINITY_DN2989_c0_g1~~TRINITY_DN2989_c0_g1_i1.p1  ORF type:complete len:662 (+),score=175.78 TRINITY_DN2989_c0_g1_i1:103-2088(+)
MLRSLVGSEMCIRDRSTGSRARILMGKASKSRRRKPRHQNPTGLPSRSAVLAEHAEHQANATDLTPEQRKDKLRAQFPLIARLDSEDPETREQGCHDVAALVCDDANLASTLARVVTSDLARIASSAGSHPERIAAVGALRNLSLHGHQVCDDMVRSGLVGTCITLLSQASEQIAGYTEPPPQLDHEHRFVCLMVEHLSSTLTHLSEASENAAMQLTAAGSVVPALFSALCSPACPLVAQRAAAQALVVLTDDSVTAQTQVANCGQAAEEFAATTLQCEGADVQLRMLLATLLFNTQGVRVSLPTLHPLLTAVLTPNVASALPTLLKGVKGDTGAAAEGLVVQQPSDNIQEWWAQLRAQNLVLEVLTNSAVFLEGDQEEDPECDWELMDSLEEEALHTHLNSANAMQTAALTELSGFLELVLPKLEIPAAECIQLGQTNQSVAAMVVALWGLVRKAVALVGNLVGGVTAQNQSAPFFVCWGKLRSLLTQTTPQPVVGQVVSGLAAVLRQAQSVGVGNELAAAKALEDPVLAAAESIAMSDQSEAADRAAALSLLGMAGQASPDSPLAERAAHTLLLALESGDPNLMVGAEALNGLFDLFGDDVANSQLYAAGQVQGKLVKLLPGWKKHVRDHASQADPAVLEGAQEAALNLKRFIQYKAAH